LLSNGFNTCINLTLILEVKIRQVTNVLDTFDAFDVELLVFQNNIQAKVVRRLNLFCNFYMPMIHNRCTICLPSCFIFGSSL
jgi:hypothetical protein